MRVNHAKKPSICRIFYKIGRHSTFDALSKVLRSPRPFFKITWSILLLLAVCACGLILLKSVFNYLAYEIVTTMTVHTEIPSKMPTIVICNSNGLMTLPAIYFAKYVYPMYGVYTKDKYLHFDYNQYQFPRMINNKANILLTKTMVMTAARDPKLSDAFRQSLALSIEDMLLSCTFNTVECTANNFTWLYDTYYGSCFKFNASGHDQVSQSGKFYGLKLELFVGEALMIEQGAQNKGVHMMIINESVTTNTFSDGVSASVGRDTTILVDKKRVRKIKKPYGHCTPNLTAADSFPSELYRITFEIYNAYRQKDCFNTCFQEFLIKNMSCYSASFAYLSNTSIPACLIGRDLFDSLSRFTVFYIQDVATQCAECPLECDSEFYTFTTSSLAYPTQIYAQMLASQPQIRKRFGNVAPTYDQLRRSIASVSVNFNELGYTQYREIQKMTILDLVTNVGGAIGLFLGLSFLSFFEIVELFVELIFYIICC